MAFDYLYGWAPYVSAAHRRRNAERELKKLAKETGCPPSPVVIEGRTIATTFWGKAWCENLERYSDFATRLPRGRSYVRHGCVVDLQIAPGEVTARVSGSELYTVDVGVAAMPKPKWRAIGRDVAGAIDSVVELLQGRLSTSVMARLTEKGAGLFPAPTEISLSCSCPDWARMCKHVAAVLYGIGARLDADPALLFTLRKVKQEDLIARAGAAADLRKGRPKSGRRVLEEAALGDVFGIDLAPAASAAGGRRTAGPGRRQTSGPGRPQASGPGPKAKGQRVAGAQSGQGPTAKRPREPKPASGRRPTADGPRRRTPGR